MIDAGNIDVITCHVRSLCSHIPQCQVGWAEREAEKPESDRRAAPGLPFDLDEPLPKDADAIDAFNCRMSAIYNASGRAASLAQDPVSGAQWTSALLQLCVSGR